jgi:hypothetical protein
MFARLIHLSLVRRSGRCADGLTPYGRARQIGDARGCRLGWADQDGPIRLVATLVADGPLPAILLPALFWR